MTISALTAVGFLFILVALVLWNLRRGIPEDNGEITELRQDRY